MHGDDSDAEGNGSGDDDLKPETESEDNSPEIDDSGVDWRAVMGPHPTVQLFTDDDDTDYDAFFANLQPFVPPEPESGQDEEEEESSSSNEEDSGASVMTMETNNEELQPLDLLVEGRGITGDNKDPSLDLSPEMKAMKNTLWSDFHERWFTLMDHMNPCIIPYHQELPDPATNAVRTIYDPLSDYYNKLGCYIFALQKDSENYKKIIAYVNESYGAIIVGETTYEVEVESVFEIEMVSDHSHDDIKGLPDEVLLLCGTERSNLLRHLHEGFFPAICSLPVPEFMFGRALFCSNAVAEDARYGYTDLEEPEGFLVFAITSLREQNTELSSPPLGTKSLQASIKFLVELKFKEKGLGDNRDNINKGW